MSGPKAYRVDAEAGIVYGLRGQPVGVRATDGYLIIRNKGRQISTVHRFIWESVNGPIPAGLQINHINGVKWDNRLANLELVTPSENLRHAYRTGLRTSNKNKRHRNEKSA